MPPLTPYETLPIGLDLRRRASLYTPYNHCFRLVTKPFRLALAFQSDKAAPLAITEEEFGEPASPVGEHESDAQSATPELPPVEITEVQIGRQAIRGTSVEYTYTSTTGTTLIDEPTDQANDSVGDIRIHTCQDSSQVWVAVSSSRWMSAFDGFVHPALEGYVLSIRHQQIPKWVTPETLRNHRCQDRKKASGARSV